MIDKLRDHNTLLSAIIYFVDEEYRNLNPNLIGEAKELIMNEILHLAMKNKLKYCLCKNILMERPDLANKQVMIGVKQGKKSIQKVVRSIRFMHSLFDKEGLDFLMIKTHKGLPYKTLDIDFLLRKEQYVLATKALENIGAIKTDGRFLNTLTELRIAMPGYHMKNLLKMDLYKGILWWLPTINEAFMWEKPRLIDFYGVKCPIPNLEADFLSLFASSLFTDRKMTLLDFLYIKSILRKKPDYHVLLRETNKCGWGKEFLKVLSLIQGLDRMIYRNKVIPKNIEFPLTLPWGILNTALPKVVINKTSKNPPSLPLTLTNALFHPFIGQIYTYATSFM